MERKKLIAVGFSEAENLVRIAAKFGFNIIIAQIDDLLRLETKEHNTDSEQLFLINLQLKNPNNILKAIESITKKTKVVFIFLALWQLEILKTENEKNSESLTLLYAAWPKTIDEWEQIFQML